MKTFRGFTFCAALAAFQCSFGWGDEGHRTVAFIALKHVKPATLARIKSILAAQDLIFKDPIEAATWPDAVRVTGRAPNAHEHHALWHYINLGFSLDGTPPVKPKSQNIQKELALLFTRARAPQGATDAEKKTDAARSLAWIEHLLGDVHQPLHCSAFSSQGALASGDLGGNDFFIKETHKDDTGHAHTTKEKLHHYWDDMFEFNRVTSPQVLANLIDGATAPHMSVPAFPSGATQRAAAVAKWVKESSGLARTVAYGVSPGSSKTIPQYPEALPFTYYGPAFTTACERVRLAGYRLAGVLDALYGG